MHTCVRSVIHENLKTFVESARVVRGRGTADLHPLLQAITETFNRIMQNLSELRKLLVTSTGRTTVRLRVYYDYCHRRMWIQDILHVCVSACVFTMIAIPICYRRQILSHERSCNLIGAAPFCVAVVYGFDPPFRQPLLPLQMKVRM